MFNIDYEIKLNDHGRPCIDLPVDYEHRPEDKFFSIELSRYILQEVYKRKSNEFDKDSNKIIETSINFLGQIGDEMAEILYNQMRALAETSKIFDNNYHVLVNGIEERDALPYKDILYNDKIFDREEGLKVCVLEYNKETFEPVYLIYELVDGIDNDNWMKI